MLVLTVLYIVLQMALLVGWQGPWRIAAAVPLVLQAFVRAASSSTAAGCTGTTESLGHADVTTQIRLARTRVGQVHRSAG